MRLSKQISLCKSALKIVCKCIHYEMQFIQHYYFVFVAHYNRELCGANPQNVSIYTRRSNENNNSSGKYVHTFIKVKAKLDQSPVYLV